MDKAELPYFKTTLENKVQVIADYVPTVQSVSIGFFLKSGVLYEKPKQLGVSHFIEHMLFKGTNKYTAKDIAKKFDRIGGYLNAFTAKDYCCFYARVISDKLELATEILTDMISNSVFDPIEFERERRVILEEIKMYEDSPDELIHELLGQNLWQNSQLGMPILGTYETITNIKRDEVYKIYQKQFVSGNLLVSLAGNFDINKFLDLLSKSMKNMRYGSFERKTPIPTPNYTTTIYNKDIEQVHIAIGCVGFAYNSPWRYAITLLNTALGGGMSSRLFQEIREKRGLAYSVYSYHSSFKHTGLFSIYAATSVENLSKVLELLDKEISKITTKGLTKSELADAKEQLKGNMLIALESTTNRMNKLSTGFLYDVEPQLPHETLIPFMQVTQDDILKVAQLLFENRNFAITIISPKSHEIEKILKKSPFNKNEIHTKETLKSHITTLFGR